MSGYVSDIYYNFYLKNIGTDTTYDFFSLYYFILAILLPMGLSLCLCKLITQKTEKDDFSIIDNDSYHYDMNTMTEMNDFSTGY